MGEVVNTDPEKKEAQPQTLKEALLAKVHTWQEEFKAIDWKEWREEFVAIEQKSAAHLDMSAREALGPDYPETKFAQVCVGAGKFVSDLLMATPWALGHFGAKVTEYMARKSQPRIDKPDAETN